MMRVAAAAALLLAMTVATAARGQAVIRVAGRSPRSPASRLLAGACLEDVNHEVYGGTYSQMVFGESFGEPPVASTVRGFTPSGGAWAVQDGVLGGDGGPGVKLVSDREPFATGTVAVDVLLPGGGGGNAGLIVGVTDAGEGPAQFDGYDVSLDAAAHTLRLGRHHGDVRVVRDVPCDVAPDRWATLAVTLGEANVEVAVNGAVVPRADDPDRPTLAGTVGVRQWHRPARCRNLSVTTGDRRGRSWPSRGRPA